MLRKLASFLIILWMMTSCRPSPPATPTPSPQASAADYAVYKALIETMYPDDKLELIVITDRTTPGFGMVGNDAKEFDYIQKSLPEVDQSLKDDFLARNTQPTPLENRFNLKIPVTLLNQTSFDSFFGKSGKGWDEFYFQYPKSQGILTLSKVGFNGPDDKALVYAGNQAYSLAGAGYAVVLGFENGQWKVLNQVMLWVS